MARRAIITGMGVVAPNGIGTDNWWHAVLAGECAIGRIERFDPDPYPVRLAGEARSFRAEDYLDQRLIAQTDRWTQMALVAAGLAMHDAALDVSGQSLASMSVILAGAAASNEFQQHELQNLWGKGPVFVGAYQSIAAFPAAAAGQISIKYAARGPSTVVAAESAGGLAAIGQARRNVQRGAPLVLSGGAEAPLSPYSLVCHLRTGLLSTQEDPTLAYQPFDERASGYVLGEGGALLSIEDSEHAHGRGAVRLYAEIAGYGATQDAYHYARPAPDALQLARAITLALTQARMSPDELDVVFADAQGTLEADATEARALHLALGERAKLVPVTAPKSMTGRLGAGSACLDVVAAVLALRHGVVPPTVHIGTPAPHYELQLVQDRPLRTQLSTALIVARGFGGFNSAMVVKKVDG